MSFGRCGSTILIDILQRLESDFNVYTEILSNLKIDEVKNILKKFYDDGDRTLLKYVFSGEKDRDFEIIKILRDFDYKFIFMDRNHIDVLISSIILLKTSNASCSVTTNELIDLDIQEIHDASSWKLTYINELFKLNIKISGFLLYEELFKNIDLEFICRKINETITQMFQQNESDNGNVLYFKFNKEKSYMFNTILKKQNKNVSSLLNVKSITNKLFEKKAELNIKMIPIINIICSNKLIKKYYEENIKLQINCDLYMHILDINYALKINSNIEKYINTGKNCIFVHDNKIVIIICFNTTTEYTVINDSDLFIDFINYCLPKKLNKILQKYSKNIYLKYETTAPTINFVKNAFIIHVDGEIDRINHLINSANLFEKLHIVDAISYKDDNMVYEFCNYLIYRKYYDETLYKNNYYDSYSCGAISLTLSNLIVLNYCIDKNISNLMIMEDDIILNKNLNDIDEYYENLPKNADLVYFGIKQDFKKKLLYYNNYFYYKNKFSWGMHSYYLNNCKTINNLIMIYQTFEKCIDCYNFEELNCVVSTKSFFIQNCELKSLINDKYNETYELWNYNLDEYNFIEKKYKFVIFNHICNNETDNTWKHFVNYLNHFALNDYKITYSDSNIKNDTLVFFDFVDKEFGWDYHKFELKYPDGVPFNWGGIVHHPCKLNKYWGNNLSVIDYFNNKYIKTCLKKCKFLIVLSDSLKNEINESNILKDYNIKIYIIYHILPNYKLYKNIENIENIEIKKNLTFLGWSFRNYSLFYDIHSLHYKKIVLPGTFTSEQAQRIKKIITIQTDSSYIKDGIEFIKQYLTEEDFLTIILNSVIFLDFDGVSANNSIVECIKYNLPVIVRNCDAVKFYLGENYPLYYNNKTDIEKYLNDYSYIIQAINYLETLDKTKFNITNNIIDVLNIIDNHSNLDIYDTLTIGNNDL